MATRRSSSPSSVARAAWLVDKHTDQRAAIVSRTIAAIQQALLVWADDWRPGVVHVPQQAALDRARAGRKAMAETTWAYLDQMGKQRAPGAPQLDEPGPSVLSNTFSKIEASLSQGNSMDEALKEAQPTLEADVDRAMTAATLEATTQHGEAVNGELDAQPPKRPTKAKARVIGYRRVIHPERSKSGTSCGLCVAASQRVYTHKDLDPIHERCKCGVAEITLDDDPGLTLNNADLAKIYKVSDGTDQASLKRTTWRIDDDGKPEAVVAPKRREEVEKTPKPPQRQFTADQLDERIRKLEELIAQREAEPHQNPAQLRALKARLASERKKRDAL